MKPLCLLRLLAAAVPAVAAGAQIEVGPNDFRISRFGPDPDHESETTYTDYPLKVVHNSTRNDS